MGAVSIAYAGNTMFRDTMNNIYYNDMDAGQGFNKAYNTNSGDRMITMIGDPTLKFGPQLQNQLNKTW